jgi:DnaJ-class molecular chaperone
MKDDIEYVDCPECGGEGNINQVETKEFDTSGKHIANWFTYDECPTCNGDGEIVNDRPKVKVVKS